MRATISFFSRRYRGSNIRKSPLPIVLFGKCSDLVRHLSGKCSAFVRHLSGVRSAFVRSEDFPRTFAECFPNVRTYATAGPFVVSPSSSEGRADIRREGEAPAEPCPPTHGTHRSPKPVDSGFHVSDLSCQRTRRHQLPLTMSAATLLNPSLTRRAHCDDHDTTRVSHGPM